MDLNNYADVASIEPLLQRFYANAIEELLVHPHVTCDLWRRLPESEVNALMRQQPTELYNNPNVGAGSALDGFRSPGSPTYGALYFSPVGMHITGGIDGDALDNLKRSGGNLGQDIAARMASDMEAFWENRNWNLFHGNTGERGVLDVTGYAITVSGGISTVQFSTEFGVKHVKPGGTYQFYDPTTNTLIGNPNGYECVDKDPGLRRARFRGDLTGLGLADGNIIVNLGCYMKEMDGLPEFTGTAGMYAFGDRDAFYQYRGQQVDADNKTLSVGILERCDTLHRYVSGSAYNGKQRIDLTSPTAESQLASLGWAQRVFNSADVVELGFRAVRYKDRTLVIDRDCSIEEWYQLMMNKMGSAMLRPFGLFTGKNASGIFESRSADGTVEDKFHWVFYGKGNMICRNPRLQLLLHSIASGAFETGDVF